ncbi:hypothetical protein GOP47_0017760 [Adiantum capillus-veneris]|uniref:Uncharacterized protein n=1 Tax=Adiantum capillus-veneris TaxID=13818 RepID=A0A9D4UGF0_ADICA|nr:hypothetical protein GOP47_0017760 [Adiantum capillus-veneris]
MAGKDSSRRQSADGTSRKRGKCGRPLRSLKSPTDSSSGLKAAFSKEGYMQEKGAFIVSVWTCKKEVSALTGEIKENWDPFWIEVNEEFESELRKDISLQRMNLMNTHALVSCNLRDDIVNTTHICVVDHEVYLKGLPMQDQALIAEVRRKYSKGAEPWYPLTRRYLARLVYDVKMSKEKDKRLDQLRHSLSEKELKKHEKQIQQDLTTKFSDKIGKLLNIVDPNLGTDWLAKVMGLNSTVSIQVSILLGLQQIIPALPFLQDVNVGVTATPGFDIMVVHRRIVVMHHDVYGYMESFGGRVECHCSMLFMLPFGRSNLSYTNHAIANPS